VSDVCHDVAIQTRFINIYKFKVHALTKYNNFITWSKLKYSKEKANLHCIASIGLFMQHACLLHMNKIKTQFRIVCDVSFHVGEVSNERKSWCKTETVNGWIGIKLMKLCVLFWIEEKQRVELMRLVLVCIYVYPEEVD